MRHEDNQHIGVRSNTRARRWSIPSHMARYGSGAALLLTALPSIVSAQPTSDAFFCAELDRTIEAVELGDVHGLKRSSARSPGFGFRYGCNVQGGGWMCHQTLAPDGLSIEGLTYRILKCRPDLTQLPANSRGFETFETSKVRLRLQESGARGAHVGRIVTFVVEPRN